MLIKKILEELGLNDKEISVYLALLENGKNPHSKIAKITKINRASVYHCAKNLQKLGLINEEVGAKNSFLIPLPPENLSQIIKRAKREVEEKEQLVNQAISELKIFSLKQEYPVPKIRFIDEANLEDFLIDNMEIWVKSMQKVDPVWWGTQDYTFSENFKKFGDWYWSQSFAKDLKMFLISNDTPVERKIAEKYQRPNRDVRFNNKIDITSSVFVAGDYVLMIVTRQKPFYLFEIHDKTLAHNMRETFRVLWENTEK
jgi:sugar-specific transcriptional regulator TrmB